MTLTALQHAPYYAAAALAAGAAGVLLAWWLRRHTTVSIRNVYLAAAAVVAIDVVALYSRAAVVLPALMALTSCTVVAAAVGRRWRLSDLGAGEELRTHERGRRWLWQRAPTRRAGERVYLTTQGQLVRERQWPDTETYVPLTADEGGGREFRGALAATSSSSGPRARAKRRRRFARPPAARSRTTRRCSSSTKKAIRTRRSFCDASRRRPAARSS